MIPTSLERLLMRLHRVKLTGDLRWKACCPAHEDRWPSLSLRLMDDDRILIHCFAGCESESVVAAVGMEMRDLMPPRPKDTPQGAGGHSGRMVEREQIQVLRALGHSVAVVAATLDGIFQGEKYAKEELAPAMDAVAVLLRASALGSAE